MNTEETDWARAVVVTAIHGEKLFGLVPQSKGDPVEYMKRCRVLNEPVVLQEVRNLVVQATIANDGRLEKMAVLMPLDVMTQAFPEYNILASSWYFPYLDKQGMKTMQGLLAHAQRIEVANQTRAIGLVAATDLNGLPPPPGR